MKSLEEYPAAIEAAQIEQDELWHEHFEASDDVSFLEARYEDEAAKDDSLTNATKRKAYVQRQKQEDSDYNDAWIRKTEAKKRATRKGFEIERLQRECEIVLLLESKKEVA